MQLIDFSDCEINNATNYGGSDRKFGIYYQGEPYMIKFAEKVEEKRGEMGTNSINNCISEYIGSHIAQSMGIPTHDTLLGTYDNEIIVACKDFCGPHQISQEFAQYMRMKYDSSDIGRLPKLEQIYDVINSVKALQPIKNEAIERYWNTFIVDALTANFDRHKGNWGYLADKNNRQISLAPTYDYGSTLYPALSKNRIIDVMKNPKEICERIYVFPTAALLVNNRKVTYRDMLLSGYDQNCSKAIRIMVPKIDTAKINNIIDETPLISDTQKDFYKTMIYFRKQFLLDKAYECAITREYDENARRRIINKTPYDKETFENDWRNGKYEEQQDIIESNIHYITEDVQQKEIDDTIHQEYN